MKSKIYRTFIILILSTLLFSCIDTSKIDTSKQEHNNNAGCDIFILVENVRGHDYIIVKANGSGGASIIHAESCKCKQRLTVK